MKKLAEMVSGWSAPGSSRVIPSGARRLPLIHRRLFGRTPLEAAAIPRHMLKQEYAYARIVPRPPPRGRSERSPPFPAFRHHRTSRCRRPPPPPPAPPPPPPPHLSPHPPPPPPP